jgi:SAM-dependent methyltransferase
MPNKIHNKSEANFNARAIQAFGQENAEMNADMPNKTFNMRLGKLTTHLDILFIKKEILPRLPPKSREFPTILDVGAGKGRITKYFITIPSYCVAIEPYEPFYNTLKNRFDSKNFEAHRYTLEEYSRYPEGNFDIIYASGVTPYLNDVELLIFMKDAARLLRHKGLLCLREFGHACQTVRARLEINRSPEDVIKIALRANFSCIRYRHAYPPVFTNKIYEAWPNKLTKFLWTYPILRMAAVMAMSSHGLNRLFLGEIKDVIHRFS